MVVYPCLIENTKNHFQGKTNSTGLLRCYVLDTAGNLIARIGSWGNAECRGPRSRYPEPEIAFSWLHSIDATHDRLYASDKDLRRIVRVRLDYRHSKETAVP